jgi:chromosome partitioning protein
MRRIALINQKGGVGKTTTVVNLGAALALAGRRVVVVDLDPQANLTLYLGVEVPEGAPSSYRVLTGEVSFASALRATGTPNLRVLPTDIHLTGAELELTGAAGREKLLRAAVDAWCAEHRKAPPDRRGGEDPADYVLFDCPPSLGILSLNALAAADEVFLVVQTQFLALQGMSRLVEVIELVKRELHPALELTGIVACMYDNRMRLAREVLAELRRYFPAQVFRTPISTNVKLAESPSFGKTIFEYAPESIGARDFAALSHEVLAQAVVPRPAPAADGKSASGAAPSRARPKRVLRKPALAAPPAESPAAPPDSVPAPPAARAVPAVAVRPAPPVEAAPLAAPSPPAEPEPRTRRPRSRPATP